MCRLSAFLQASSLPHLPLFPHSTLLQTFLPPPFISFIPKFYFTTVTRLPAPFYKKLMNLIIFHSLGVRHISGISANHVLLSQANLLECSLSFDESHNKSPSTRGVLTRGSTFFPITFSQAAQRGLQFCGTYPPLDFKGTAACKMNAAVRNVQTLAQTDGRPAHLA